MLQTINFTNRERIEMGDEIETFVQYLSKKLPGADYESEATESTEALREE